MPVLPACDMCANVGVNSTAAYDGKTTLQAWAYMCPGCFERFGVGLGIGKGQRLILTGEGERS